jgi:hypothetical protein
VEIQPNPTIVIVGVTYREGMVGGEQFLLLIVHVPKKPDLNLFQRPEKVETS